MDLDQALALQRLGALVLLGWFAGRVARVRVPARAPSASRSLLAYTAVIVCLFAAIFSCQAFWTLFAGDLPRYRQVERFDARVWQLSRPGDRRAVVDRQGVALIRNDSRAGRVERVYPRGAETAHVTGYFDRVYGRCGIEGACDAYLTTARRSAFAALRELSQPSGLPAPLRLTLDARLQRAACVALAGRRGAVVVLSPVRGDVLVLASSPSFDPGRVFQDFPALQANPAKPLLDRALQGLYPPGSTFKPVVAATALAAGYPLATAFECGPNGYLPPGDTQRILDFEASERAGWRGRGLLDLPHAVAWSSNTYFAWLGVQLGGPALLAGARSVGWERAWDLVPGAWNGPDLVAAAGRLPRGRLKAGDVARCAIGQHEILISPLGLAGVAATLANYGTVVPPRLILDTPAASGWRAMPARTARDVQRLLRGVVELPGGTGRGLRLPGLAVAGKTGSAENPHGAAHGWVIAFAPVERATLALAVVIENGGTGSGSAVPVARAVLRAAEAAGYFPAARRP